MGYKAWPLQAHLMLGVLALLLCVAPSSGDGLNNNIFAISTRQDNDGPLLIDENTTWTTSRNVNNKIIIFPGAELRIEGTPDNKVLLNYQFDCANLNSYYSSSGVNTTIGFALQERSTLIMKHVEITSTCTDRTGPVVFYFINNLGVTVNYTNVYCHGVYSCGPPNTNSYTLNAKDSFFSNTSVVSLNEANHVGFLDNTRVALISANTSIFFNNSQVTLNNVNSSFIYKTPYLEVTQSMTDCVSLANGGNDAISSYSNDRFYFRNANRSLLIGNNRMTQPSSVEITDSLFVGNNFTSFSADSYSTRIQNVTYLDNNSSMRWSSSTFNGFDRVNLASTRGCSLIYTSTSSPLIKDIPIYWGTNDISAIEASICDGKDGSDVGIIRLQNVSNQFYMHPIVDRVLSSGVFRQRRKRNLRSSGSRMTRESFPATRQASDSTSIDFAGVFNPWEALLLTTDENKAGNLAEYTWESLVRQVADASDESSTAANRPPSPAPSTATPTIESSQASSSPESTTASIPRPPSSIPDTPEPSARPTPRPTPTPTRRPTPRPTPFPTQRRPTPFPTQRRPTPFPTQRPPTPFPTPFPTRFQNSRSPTPFPTAPRALPRPSDVELNPRPSEGNSDSDDSASWRDILFLCLGIALGIAITFATGIIVVNFCLPWWQARRRRRRNDDDNQTAADSFVDEETPRGILRPEQAELLPLTHEEPLRASHAVPVFPTYRETRRSVPQASRTSNPGPAPNNPPAEQNSQSPAPRTRQGAYVLAQAEAISTWNSKRDSLLVEEVIVVEEADKEKQVEVDSVFSKEEKNDAELEEFNAEGEFDGKERQVEVESVHSEDQENEVEIVHSEEKDIKVDGEVSEETDDVETKSVNSRMSAID